MSSNDVIMSSNEVIMYFNTRLLYHVGFYPPDELQIRLVSAVNILDHKAKVDFFGIFSYVNIYRSYPIVKDLIHKGLNVNISNEWNFTPLHYAYIMNDKKFIEELKRSGANENAVITNGKHLGKKPIDFQSVTKPADVDSISSVIN